MRVHLVCWDADEGRSRAAALAGAGHDVVFEPGLAGTALLRTLRDTTADAVVIDLERRPSHGREVAAALRVSPATRQRPIVFAGGTAEAAARALALLPDTVHTPWARVGAALRRATPAAASPPGVPRDAAYAGRTLAQKLGIKADDRLTVIGAPSGFAARLAPVPAGVRLTGDLSAPASRYLWFVRSRRELQQAVTVLAARLTTEVAWLAWPKAASGVVTDLGGNDVRETGLSAGLVDFKVCSIDATWSGLAFKRRRR